MRRLINQGMSLKTQIYGLLLGLMVISFIGRLYFTVENTKTYFQEQMSSHAQDTATSLGLSISPYMDEPSLPIAETMIAAIFDSGYYRSITFVDTQGNIVFSRVNPIGVEGVPKWFINTVPLFSPKKSSEVNSGWQIAGTLHVESHPGVSYQKMWEQLYQSFWSMLFITLACIGAAHFILKAIFKPLNILEKQAISVSQKKFFVSESVPFTKELRAVTNAMNKMVQNLQTSFEAMTKQNELLTKETFIDEQTGWGNRRSFNSYFNAKNAEITNDETHTIALIALPSLNQLNNEQGYQAGDEYVSTAAKLITQQLESLTGFKTFRIAGGTLIIYFEYELSIVANVLKEMGQHFKQLDTQRYANGFATLSVVPTYRNESIKEVLSKLDITSTLNAQNMHSNDPVSPIGLSEWRDLIHDIIKSGDVDFSFQPVVSSNKNDEGLYYEVFARFYHKSRQVSNAQLFAMAERLDLTLELDKKLIKSFVDFKEQHLRTRFALNLSQQAFYSDYFYKWLKAFTESRPALKTDLIFEVKEVALLADINTAGLKVSHFKELGIDMCIEHFGTSLTSFKYLQGLDVEYVKIDGSYTQDLLNNPQNNFFMQTITNICKSLGIKVISCLIENKETFQAVQSLECDGAQGNYIQKPYKVSEQIKEKVFTLHTKGLEL